MIHKTAERSPAFENREKLDPPVPCAESHPRTDAQGWGIPLWQRQTLLMHLAHGSFSLLGALGNHIDFIHVNGASCCVNGTLDSHAVPHVIFEGIRIVHVENCFVTVLDKNYMLARLEALVATVFVT